jgi:hypothetical protein
VSKFASIRGREVGAVQNAGILKVVVQNRAGEVPLPISQMADSKTVFIKKRLA